MFANKVAHYINTNMERLNMTYKALEKASGVPTTTLHAWAQGRVKNPNEEYLIRIAASFGDPPEVIQQMRRESLAMTVQENQLIADAHDKELMETYVELINSNVTRLLEQSRIDSDNRYVKRLNTVRDQYDKLFEEQKQNFERQLEEHKVQSADAYEKATEYLKKDISYYRKVIVAIIIAALLVTIPLAGYTVYCYKVFDQADPTQGLYQRPAAPEEGNIGLEGET